MRQTSVAKTYLVVISETNAVITIIRVIDCSCYGIGRKNSVAITPMVSHLGGSLCLQCLSIHLAVHMLILLVII